MTTRQPTVNDGCGWCRQAHIADQVCRCHQLCAAGWCAAEPEDWI